MAEAPWVTIIGLGEDGLDGLSPASRDALAAAEIVMGPTRHLALLGDIAAEVVEWPVPFADGLPKLLGRRGRRVVVLASGDPFWFGAGRAIARSLTPGEWRAFPGISTFSLVAARLGWPLDQTCCLGLHAAPIQRIRRHLAKGARLIVLLRDGAAVSDLAACLETTGFDASFLHVCEAMGGPRERIRHISVADARSGDFRHPVCVAVEVAGGGPALPKTSGLPDNLFKTDGVMTKRAVRALTLSALAPKPGEYLWDIGGGSGSIAVEWALAHPSCRVSSIELRSDRAALIEMNAAAFGVAVDVVTGGAPEVLDRLDAPDVVFVGGGLDRALLDDLRARLAPGVRLVANAVTLETEALLAEAQADLGGDLMRIEVSNITAMGLKRGWKAAYPVVQWSVVL
ncbi:precorrin-6y C5,15-methyltransferase (decarboxylating) subunit CbiE [Aestuariivita sp.]|jgi:precorrin-6Y C5,15-methyltransferase (decarboxylating)|uniref:precorrin-6y C5,15-methyltransferase (decarboxylating) subunit CbiE n=1 Tax=Aestuariivita sp. TaxID=1872407 RepID=UPI0021717603|nr:precorrin-6y C5,15-methyltransferase (decarboxylating) subunit CbiE [Aestuariivita sp.]MCE8009623.1 precorrin-6y C5,15-methyltransferase (decarboxylating) subunit CbiE [Aestuariivita sp.]